MKETSEIEKIESEKECTAANELEGMRSSPICVVDLECSQSKSLGSFEESKLVEEISSRLLSVEKRENDFSFCMTRGDLPTLEEVPGSSTQRSRIQQETRNDFDEMDQKEVERLKSAASNLAIRGNEKKAIKTYKQALRLTTGGVARIQQRMEAAGDETEEMKKCIHKGLLKEWTELALTIAEIKIMMSILYERTGDYDRALKACSDASDVYERQLQRDTNSKSRSLTATKGNLEKAQHMRKKLSGAKKSKKLRSDLHDACKKIHEQIIETEEKGVKNVFFEALLNKVSEILRIETENLGMNHPQIAETLFFLSQLHLERNDKAKAILAMQRSVSVAETCLGSLHPKTGEKYHQLARQFEGLQRDRCDQANAILFYEKAIDTYNEADGDCSRLIASVSNDLGVLLMNQGLTDQAIQKLSDALTGYESTNENDNKFCADTAQIWRNLAECNVLRSEWDLAAMNFLSALRVQRDARKIYDTLGRHDPNVEMPLLISDESIADTLRRLGKTYAAKKEYEKAIQILLEALTIFQNACEQAKKNTGEKSSFDLAGKQDHVASIIFCIAEVKEANCQFDEAMKLYEEARELRSYSDRLRPKGMRLNSIHRAMCTAGIGSLYLVKGNSQLAFKAFNEAIYTTRKEGLPEYHPIVQNLWEKSREAAEKMAREGDERFFNRIMEEGLVIPVAPIDSPKFMDNEDERPEEAYVGSPRNEKLPLQEASQATLDLEQEHRQENEDTNSKTETESRQSSTWFQTASRLETKAQQRKEKGDICGAMESTRHVLDFRRAYLSKRHDSKKTTTKAKQQVAKTLVSLAYLNMIIEENKEAMRLLQEALGMYKSSGLKKEDEQIQEIQRELERLKFQNKATKNTANKKST